MLDQNQIAPLPYIENTIKNINDRLFGKVVTKASLLKNYCPAEEYHQRYLEKR